MDAHAGGIGGLAAHARGFSHHNPLNTKYQMPSTRTKTKIVLACSPFRGSKSCGQCGEAAHIQEGAACGIRTPWVQPGCSECLCAFAGRIPNPGAWCDFNFRHAFKTPAPRIPPDPPPPSGSNPSPVCTWGAAHGRDAGVAARGERGGEGGVAWWGVACAMYKVTQFAASSFNIKPTGISLNPGQCEC